MKMNEKCPVLGLLVLLLVTCSEPGDLAICTAFDDAGQRVTDQLRARSNQIQQGLVRVSENVYTAIGYSPSTSSMIIGPDGVIIVDPSGDLEVAREVRAAFQKITEKPVRAIVYTHSHIDHTSGAAAYVDDGADVQIWARDCYDSELRVIRSTGMCEWVRPAFTNGSDLPDDQLFLSHGMQRPKRSFAQGLDPTHTFSEERVSLELAGVQFELVAAPGETSDQLYVWLPAGQVLFAGDNVCDSWPSVYSIRGPGREMRDWIASLDKMLAQRPERMVRGHGAPVLEGVEEQLCNLRDAMRWVYEHTVEGVNQGLTADEVVEHVRLPQKYTELDYLADYYGALEYSVRHLYGQLVGWFDGDPLQLLRETPLEQSERMARLLGGQAALLERARAAAESGDDLGAAQLARHLVRLRPDDPESKKLLADAFEALSQDMLNLPARYYTLSYSQRLRLPGRKNPACAKSVGAHD